MVRVFSIWLTRPWSSAHPAVREGRSAHCQPQPEALSYLTAPGPLPSAQEAVVSCAPTLPKTLVTNTVLLVFLTDSPPSEDLDPADPPISVTVGLIWLCHWVRPATTFQSNLGGSVV